MASKPQHDTKPVVPRGELGSDFNLVALSGEIGLNLALPLVIFMIIGIKMDWAAHTTPLFMLLGVALSLSTSIILIARMISRVNRSSRKDRP